MAMRYNPDTGQYEEDYYGGGYAPGGDPYVEQNAPAPAGPALGSFGVPENGGNPAGYMDLSYWQSRHDQGLPGAPSVDDMFDANGQLKPGWKRTARGYEMVSPAATTPTSGGGDPYGGYPTTYGGGGGFGYLTEPYGKTPPNWTPGPGFQPPTFSAPPPFSYQKFQVPTADSIYSDPSYDFRRGEGEKALGQRAASMGTYRTGGTLKDFINYNQNAASQEYSNIFKRAVDTHNLGLEQELGTYGTNYGVSRDVYDRLYQGSKATFDAQQRESELVNNRNFDSFLADYDIFTRDRKRVSDELWRGVDTP